MIFKFPQKFADNNIDDFINGVYIHFKTSNIPNYLFDLSEVEYLGNQELLVLTALLKTFSDAKIKFKIQFLEKGVFSSDLSERVKRQIIQIWDTWKIWKVVSESSYLEYFDIDGNTVDRFKKDINYSPRLQEIYNRHGVTPFISLDYIRNYNEIEITKSIKPIYQLNAVVEELLRQNNCNHPFTSQSLSSIITEELYLNFLDHSGINSFSDHSNGSAFMSISFQPKLDERKHNSRQIQHIKGLNFATESLPEAKNFFFNSNTKEFKNISYLTFSFLDFGYGIPNTLREEYLRQHKDDAVSSDLNILHFSFRSESSRHPILDADDKADKLIPRGLFDAFTIVRRYGGLLIARSNHGKIIYDFSDPSATGGKMFGNPKLFLPGTLITIYIPAIEDSNSLNISSIKPIFPFVKVKPGDRKYVNINSIARKLNIGKESLYGNLVSLVRNTISNNGGPCLIFFSFLGSERIDKRILRKTLYILLSDYSVNNNTNVIIIDPPSKDLIDEIQAELIDLNEAIKNYKIHPLPIVDFKRVIDETKIDWIGIYNDLDKRKLNDLLFEDFSIARSDFQEPYNVIGHLNSFDTKGNLHSNFVSYKEFDSSFFNLKNRFFSDEVQSILKQFDCIKTTNGYFLNSSNYYQNEFIDLNRALNEKTICKIISQYLFSAINDKINSLSEVRFIGITSASRKILKAITALGLISPDASTIFDNWSSFESDFSTELIESDTKYVLVCDIISTGSLTDRLENKLKSIGSQLTMVAVVVSAIDPLFDLSRSFLDRFSARFIALHVHTIKKFRREQLSKESLNREIIRVNPLTSIPITLSLEDTNFNDSIIFPSKVSYLPAANKIEISNPILDSIDNDFISVGFMKYNNLIHPYFFKTDFILRDMQTAVLDKIFNKIGNKSLFNDPVQAFYPRKSGVEHLDFHKIREALKNHQIEEIELERISTSEGWRFPHNIDYLSGKIENNVCLIIDDGSCTGESLIQMVDEISFYQAKEIVLLCFIGRVNDHKREFFSRISSIKVHSKKPISISIYFASHWHIPTYYIDDNPNIRETNWLNEIINLQNSPASIKRIAKSIKREIKAKNELNFTDYKYLPKDKITGAIPKKDLILVREELGKVTGYRLYKESFDFFDGFVKKYNAKKKSEDRYKEIELLCAVFTLEPYIFGRISRVLPDVVEKVEEFVRVLIFGDEKIYDSLTYSWNKKDIIHLFFIVFKDEKLICELTIDKFRELIAFTQETESTINYVLYKLLRYFPLESSQFKEMKFDIQLRNLIGRLRESEGIPRKAIRKYYNFINSLPSRNDFTSQLTLLRENYNKENETDYHDQKKSFNHNVSLLIVTVKQVITDLGNKEDIDTTKFKAIRKCWFNLRNFIIPILSFSESFRDFLIPYTRFDLSNQTKSLREITGYIEELVYSPIESFYDKDKLEKVSQSVVKIQGDFEVNSTFHQLIDFPESDVFEFIEQLENEIGKVVGSLRIHGDLVKGNRRLISVPKLYVEKLILLELAVNMNKYFVQDISHKPSISYLQTEEFILITIENYFKGVDSKSSNGEGLKCLYLLSECSLFGFQYESKSSGTQYFQTLRFKIL